MEDISALDAIPLWGVFVLALLFVFVFNEAGYRLGRYRLTRSEHETEAPVGTMVAAMLGLLAFMLAFTFGLAAQRFDTRRQVLLDEANAIGTTYLRAAMLPERGEEIRSLLREYVDVRLTAVQSNDVANGIRRSEALQNEIWGDAVGLSQKNPESIVVGLFVQSLNELIDLHAKRVTAGRNRIPGPVWLVLFSVAGLSLGAMGYHAGLLRTSRSFAIIAVGLSFTAVIGLIADLDRPTEGVLKVSQQALIDARQSMKPPGAP